MTKYVAHASNTSRYFLECTGIADQTQIVAAAPDCITQSTAPTERIIHGTATSLPAPEPVDLPDDWAGAHDATIADAELTRLGWHRIGPWLPVDRKSIAPRADRVQPGNAGMIADVARD